MDIRDRDLLHFILGKMTIAKLRGRARTIAHLQRTVVSRRSVRDVPPSTVRVAILGSEDFANHVSRIFHFAAHESDLQQPEHSHGTTNCAVYWLSKGSLEVEPPRVPMLEADVLLCDVDWWCTNAPGTLVRWVSADGLPPALLAHSRDPLSIDEWDLVEHAIGGYLVGCSQSAALPVSKSLWGDIVACLGRRTGRAIADRIIESLAALGQLDPDDSCIAAIQLALAGPECFPNEPSFAAAADQLKVRSSSPDRPRDSKVRAMWRPLRSKKLERRFRKLGLASPGEFLRQCRLLHGLLRYKMRSLLRPDESPPLGLLARTLGYGRGASADAALTALNNHARRLFLGMEFGALVSRVAIEEVTYLLGWEIAGELWIGPQPGPVRSSLVFASPDAYDRWLFEAAALNPIDPPAPPVIGFGTSVGDLFYGEMKRSQK